jgi:hypothetical protein
MSGAGALPSGRSTMARRRSRSRSATETGQLRRDFRPVAARHGPYALVQRSLDHFPGECDSRLSAAPPKWKANVRSSSTVDVKHQSDAARASHDECSGPSGDRSHRAARERWRVRGAGLERDRAVAVLDPLGVVRLLSVDQGGMSSLPRRDSQGCLVARAEAHWELYPGESPGARAIRLV